MTTFRVSALTTQQVQKVAKQRLISTRELTEALGCKRQTLLQRVERGTFPEPIATIGGAFVWDMREVREFLPK